MEIGLARAPFVLCIVDGWGIYPDYPGNAVSRARTPTYDRLWSCAQHTTLKAHGTAVGLPLGQTGNSEIGHTNIGAGRVILPALPRINDAISKGEFLTSNTGRNFIAAVKAKGGAIHIMGLLSEGGIHGNWKHVAESALIFDKCDVRVKLHIFLDGRDTPLRQILSDIELLKQKIQSHANITIATISGRYYAMDRDQHWDRIEPVYRAIVMGNHSCLPHSDSVHAAVQDAYNAGIDDEFIYPTIIGEYSGISDCDGLFAANFRSDRFRELLSAFLDPDFSHFNVHGNSRFGVVLGMISYAKNLDAHMDVLFPSEKIQNTLGEWLSIHGKRQFRVAETEKYPHVTFFFNGGRETPWPMEERVVIPSPRDVKTYDEAPMMSISSVSDTLNAAIRSRQYDFILCNLANPDMVGHTGNFHATIQAVEATDKAIATMMQAVDNVDGTLIVTSDHGNCEMMTNPDTGIPNPSHTPNPVPLFIVSKTAVPPLIQSRGALCNIAPTILALAGLPAPEQMAASLFS